MVAAESGLPLASMNNIDNILHCRAWNFTITTRNLRPYRRIVDHGCTIDRKTRRSGWRAARVT
jgi:hypothetical protein